MMTFGDNTQISYALVALPAQKQATMIETATLTTVHFPRLFHTLSQIDSSLLCLYSMFTHYAIRSYCSALIYVRYGLPTRLHVHANHLQISREQPASSHKSTRNSTHKFLRVLT